MNSIGPTVANTATSSFRFSNMIAPIVCIALAVLALIAYVAVRVRRIRAEHQPEMNNNLRMPNPLSFETRDNFPELPQLPSGNRPRPTFQDIERLEQRSAAGQSELQQRLRENERVDAEKMSALRRNAEARAELLRPTSFPVVRAPIDKNLIRQAVELVKQEKYAEAAEIFGQDVDKERGSITRMTLENFSKKDGSETDSTRLIHKCFAMAFLLKLATESPKSQQSSMDFVMELFSDVTLEVAVIDHGQLEQHLQEITQELENQLS